MKSESVCFHPHVFRIRIRMWDFYRTSADSDSDSDVRRITNLSQQFVKVSRRTGKLCHYVKVSAIMSECGECEKVLKPNKGSPSIYCAFCKNKYHKTCNRYNLIYQENETETIVWCRNCVRNKFNERDQTLANHEKQLSSLVDKVKDLTDKMNELINQKNTSN